jgi:hypothetical protein
MGQPYANCKVIPPTDKVYKIYTTTTTTTTPAPVVNDEDFSVIVIPDFNASYP